jgi:hypothetical protein
LFLGIAVRYSRCLKCKREEGQNRSLTVTAPY